MAGFIDDWLYLKIYLDSGLMKDWRKLFKVNFYLLSSLFQKTFYFAFFVMSGAGV